MITPEAVISDSDGTLVDTLHLIRHGQYETFKTYFTQKGVDPVHIPNYEAYEPLLNQTVGGSARDTLERTARRSIKIILNISKVLISTSYTIYSIQFKTKLRLNSLKDTMGFLDS